MRAGLLTEVITFRELQETKLPSGAVKKDYVDIQTVKAAKKKLSAAVGTGINASEEFISSTIVFQVRAYPFIESSMRVKYGEREFDIILMDKQPDNTYLITCKKLNL